MTKLPSAIAKFFRNTPDTFGRIFWWCWWLPFIGVPPVIGWLWSTIPWFWHWFGLAGVTVAALITATLMMGLMAAYRHWKYSGLAQIEKLRIETSERIRVFEKQISEYQHRIELCQVQFDEQVMQRYQAVDDERNRVLQNCVRKDEFKVMDILVTGFDNRLKELEARQKEFVWYHPPAP